jgi:hypothetical protein
LVLQEERHPGEELDAFPVFLGGRMAKPEMTHGMHLRGEDRAHVSADGFDGGEPQQVLASPVGAISPTQEPVVFLDV